MKNSMLFLALLFCLGCSSQNLDTIEITGGEISGRQTADGAVHIYQGIPFAAPPVGDLRWKSPQPVKPWEGVLECTDFGPSPMQGEPRPFSMWSKEYLIRDEPISEDCLYLNVWTGSQSPSEKRPVVVWIYGGGFNSGGTNVPIYDGESFARKGVVFVSINYRVNVFGFLAHPELTAESEHNASGNYGIQDQIAGLQWVKENIAAFGGDPANVTIAGQSAGSMSVNTLVASPLAEGLFNKAIAESGALLTGGSQTLAQAEQNGVQAVSQFNAASIAELRALSTEEIFKARVNARPIVDGYVLPKDIKDIFAANEQNRVDLLTGWNEDEGFTLGAMLGAEGYQQRIKNQYGSEADEFLRYYPGSTDEEAEASQYAAGRDVTFGVQNYAWAKIQAQAGTNVFVYSFTRDVPGEGEYANYGAFHTGEVPYAYGNLKFVNRPWEQADHDLSEAMAEYWTNFIKTGNPNGSGLPQWPKFTPDKKETIFLGKEITSSSMPDAERLEFLYGVLGNN